MTRRGLTPLLLPDEARSPLNAIDVTTIKGLRDRALIATMTFTFASVSAALALTLGDYQRRGRRAWLRLHEKGGQSIDLPCYSLLEDYLENDKESRGGDPGRTHGLRGVGDMSPM